MLQSAKLVAFVAAADPARAKAFYGGKLGFRLLSEDQFAAVFDCNGVTLRVSAVGEVNPAAYTVLGWEVSDIAITAAELAARGIPLERYSFLEQDEAGVWTAPGGVRVAWFRDPDGNLLSVSQHPGAAQ